MPIKSAHHCHSGTAEMGPIGTFSN